MLSSVRRFALMAVLLLFVGLGAGTQMRAQTDAGMDSPLRGTVFAWSSSGLQRVEQASVSTGLAHQRTDETGRFEFAADERSGWLAVVKPGYDVVRRTVYGDSLTIVLRELVVRAVFVPFEQSGLSATQDWLRSLVQRDLINAIVFDIKEEAGRVAALASTPATEAIGATRREDGTAAFLEELGRIGIYRIGRVVTFLDDTYAGAYPSRALGHVNGKVFRDGMGLRWSSPFSAEVRRYNVDIGVSAAQLFDEIQYDYVRLPYENGLAERAQNSAAQREAAINTFAAEAAEALHMAGAAISFDVFGVIAVSSDDSGIGQSLYGLSQHLDYLSPMLYPSGWSPGEFGLSYPPQHPGTVIQRSMDAAMSRLAPGSNTEVRPWLQDFTDYQARKLWYGVSQVSEQIQQTAATGGYGFMLWDPSLQYQVGALELTQTLDWSLRREHPN